MLTQFKPFTSLDQYTETNNTELFALGQIQLMAGRRHSVKETKSVKLYDRKHHVDHLKLTKLNLCPSHILSCLTIAF